MTMNGTYEDGGTTWSTEPELWSMSDSVFIFTLVVLCLEIVMSIFSNIVLVVIILHSPNLKSASNAPLINICVTNLLLTVEMVLSMASLLAPDTAQAADFTHFVRLPQLFIDVTCFCQYLCVFSAIGYYRHHTIKHPTMSIKHRKRVICYSILSGWCGSLGLAGALTGVFCTAHSTLNWNAFRRTIEEYEMSTLEMVTLAQLCLMILALLFIAIQLAIILRTYYCILKTLCRTHPICRPNRVTPTSTARHDSVTSDDNEIDMWGQRSYHPADNRWTAPFTVSDGNTTENVVVHYEKRSQSVVLDDMFAFEFPIQAQRTAHRNLQMMMSNCSNMSTRSGKLHGFSDISPGAELQQLQVMKNKFALCNQSWRRDQITLRSATKNCLFMMFTFIICSFPLCLCSMPSVIHPSSLGALDTSLLFCRLLYYVNAPAYPIWYLICSKRVKKCLLTLFDSALIKMNIRQ